ncbi:MAG: V/A-type H+/Na+-transporting ATPase subunit I [Methanoregula sp. SKADARSKE-2]|nr:MAG: V/A-type H+/Na+-transporting ATPase subunit I [Methanoregula sp. SKADARSKE-2]
MLAPKRMSRLLIAASRDQLSPVIAELYRHHLFHIEEYVDSGADGYEGFRIGAPLSGASEASTDLLKIRAIENAVSINAEDIEFRAVGARPELMAKIEWELPLLEREVEELTGRRLKLEIRVKELQQKIQEIMPFSEVPFDLDLLRGYKEFSVFAGYVAREPPLTVPSEVYFAKGKEKSFIIVIVLAVQRDAVEKALQGSAFLAVQIPEESGSAQKRITDYTGQIASAVEEISEIAKKLDEVKTKHAGFLVACEEVLRAEVEKTEAPLRFATTRQTFVAEGWVPSESVDAVSSDLVKATGGKIYVTVIPTDIEHDSVPVEYNNPSFAKPIQLFMDVYSRPKYTEVDPTLMLAIVFPLFFGLILGDFGYGLILLALAFVLGRFMKGEDGQQFLKVLRNASISTIIFGLLFSEFLGAKLLWEPLLPSRHLNIGGEATGHGAAIPDLMVLSLWIGILHITLGRVLGMYNHAKQDHGEHRTKTVMANFGWLAVMWGLVIAIWSFVPIPLMPDLRGLPAIMSGVAIGCIIGAVFIVLGVVFIARDAVLEVIELPTIISHVLSYTRLVAVGLSSVAIAMIVNYMSIEKLISPGLEDLSIVGILMILVGVVIFLLGHTLNVALGILGGGLHSIRLHYVEFFTKFYKGGGKKYVPFGMKRRFTEE